MKKFAVMIDWKAAVKCALDMETLEATNLVDAMIEAEKFLSPDVYMVKLCQKSGKIERAEGCKNTYYKEILANRGNGWHANDEDHGEGTSTWILQESHGFTDWLLKI